MMDVGTRFITSAAVTEIVPLYDARILEQAHGAINGRNRDSVVDPDAATIELFDIRMIVRLCEDTCDDAALLGHAHSFGGAQSLDVLFLGDIPVCGAHGASLTSVRPGTAFLSYLPCPACVYQVIKGRAGTPARRRFFRHRRNNSWADATPRENRHDGKGGSPGHCARRLPEKRREHRGLPASAGADAAAVVQGPGHAGGRQPQPTVSPPHPRPAAT